MPHAAQLTGDGAVENVIVIDDAADPAAFRAVLCPDDVQIGWSLVGGVFVAPAPPAPTPAPVPETISDRQFFEALADWGLIGQAEAEAAVTVGDLPQALLDLVDGLPEDQRFKARMRLRGATQFERSHPLCAVFGAAFPNWSEARTDDLWRYASTLR